MQKGIDERYQQEVIRGQEDRRFWKAKKDFEKRTYGWPFLFWIDKIGAYLNEAAYFCRKKYPLIKQFANREHES